MLKLRRRSIGGRSFILEFARGEEVDRIPESSIGWNWVRDANKNHLREIEIAHRRIRIEKLEGEIAEMRKT